MNPVEVLASSSGTGGSGSGGGTVDFSGAATPVVQLINSLLGPVISVVVAVAAVYCVILGVKLAKADEPQERENALCQTGKITCLLNLMERNSRRRSVYSKGQKN